MLKDLPTKPKYSLCASRLLGFHSDGTSGRATRIGAAKIGLSITGASGLGSIALTVGVPATGGPSGTLPFLSLNAINATGPYSITFTDPTGIVSFTASTTISGVPVDATITGNGTSTITISSDFANNITQILETTLSFLASAPGNDTIQVSATSGSGQTATGSINLADSSPPCFVSGTQIATSNGAVRVEDLCVGDRVVTASGAIRPVRWIGHVTMDFHALRQPSSCYPVRVRAGAFGRNLPQRDLLLSPGHHVFADGILVPVWALENAITIAREPVSQVTYWHVELDTHDVILAEGLPTESYLDTGNRSSFRNNEAVVSLRPSLLDSDVLSEFWAAAACAPRAHDGQRVTNLRWRLLEEAKTLGIATTADPDLRLIVDGQSVAGEWTGGSLRLDLPPGAKTLRILSRATLPIWSNPANDDNRVLGVNVLEASGDGLSLAHDGPAFVSGFSYVEREGEQAWRWTCGDATLDVTGVRSLTMRVAFQDAYPVVTKTEPDKSERAQAA